MDTFKWNGDTLQREIIEETKELLLMAATKVQEKIVRSMPTNGSYKPYKRPWGIHWSSRPGQRPAIDYKRLNDSISVNTSWSNTEHGQVGPSAKQTDGVSKPTEHLAVRIGTLVPYAEYLEDPTKTNRPFIRPELPYAQTLLRNLFVGSNFNFTVNIVG